MNTKEKILFESLNLFSTRGYDAVSIREIARAVGIKESSIYNHYRNKQEIFDSIIQEYSGRWSAFFNQMQLTGDAADFAVDTQIINRYKFMTNDQFAAIAAVIFDFYFTDDINVKLRKMLTIEQYRSQELVKLFRDISFDESLDYQAQLFAALIQEGCFIQTDPYIMALEFFSPIFLIFFKFDNTPDDFAAAKALFLRHIDHFNKLYGTGDPKMDRKE